MKVDECGVEKSYFFGIKANSLIYFLSAIYFLFASATILIFNAPIGDSSDAYYFLEVAKNLHDGNGFLEGYLKAFRPPIYSGFIAGLYSVGIDNNTALKFVMAVFMSGSVIIAGRIGKELFGEVAGVTAALSVTVFPWFILMPDSLLSENLFIPALLLLLYRVLIAFKEPNYKNFIVAGFWCGVCSLIREVTFYTPLALFLTILIVQSLPSFKKFAFLAVFIIVECAVIAPWTYRNYVVFEEFIPISTNAWINIYLGNNPRADADIQSDVWELPEGVKWNYRPQVKGEDELAAAEACKIASLDYISENPKKFVVRTIKKIFLFVTPHFNILSDFDSVFEKMIVLFNLLLYSFFAGAFIIYFLRNCRFVLVRPMLVFSVLFACYVIAIAGLTYSNSRYRLPLTTIALLYSSVYSAALYRWFYDRYLGKLSGKKDKCDLPS